MLYVVVFFISLILTIFATPYVIKYLKKGGVLDKPDSRKVHTEVTPRMGGIVIFSVLIIVLFSFYKDLNSVRFLIIGFLLITLCGIIDDIVGLKWSYKFIIQFLSAAFIMLFLEPYYENITFFGWTLPLYLDKAILFIFIVGAINSINLMDGMDGLVSGFSLLVFGIIIVLSSLRDDYITLLLSVSLAGSLLGFLKFNAFPARIFLGDTGSLFLGFFLVVLSLKTSISYNTGNISLGFATLILAVPIIDTLKVMVKRIFLKKNPFLPDNNHLHHVIYHNQVRHKTTVFIIEIFTLIFIALSLYFLKTKSIWVFPVFILLSLSLVYANFIFSKLNLFKLLKNNYDKITRLPQYGIYLYKTYLISISALAAAGVIVSSVDFRLSFNHSEIWFLIISGMIMLALALVHNTRSNAINHIYFFFNITAFFLLSRASDLFNKNEYYHSEFFAPNLIFIISAFILTTVVIFFLAAREKIIPKEKIFLTGLDLTMIVVIALVFIIQNFVDLNISLPIAESLIMGFVFYLWYKIIVVIKPNFDRVLFYGSFSIPLIFLTILLMAN